MTLEITPASASVAVAAVSLVAGWLRWIDIAQAKQITAVKTTQITLFNKLDERARELAEFRTYVAERYVSENALEKTMQPLTESIKELRADIKTLMAKP